MRTIHACLHPLSEGAQKVQVLLADWSFREKATPHCSSAKSVVIASGGAGIQGRVSTVLPMVLHLNGRPPAALGFVDEHMWLGLMWSSY